MFKGAVISQTNAIYNWKDVKSKWHNLNNYISNWVFRKIWPPLIKHQVSRGLSFFVKKSRWKKSTTIESWYLKRGQNVYYRYRKTIKKPKELTASTIYFTIQRFRNRFTKGKCLQMMIMKVVNDDNLWNFNAIKINYQLITSQVTRKKPIRISVLKKSKQTNKKDTIKDLGITKRYKILKVVDYNHHYHHQSIISIIIFFLKFYCLNKDERLLNQRNCGYQKVQKNRVGLDIWIVG